MGIIITVTSGKSGTGKTTAAAKISSCLAMLKYKTLCIDFGTGSQNVLYNLSIEDKKNVDIMRLLNGEIKVIDACSAHPGIPGLYVLSMSVFFNSGRLDVSDVMPMFKEIRRDFDYIIIDTPSITFPGFNLAHADADISIIVTNGDVPTMIDVLRASQCIHDAGINEVKLLVNRVIFANTEQIRIDVDNILGKIGAKMIGLIPEDESASQSPLSNNSDVIHRKRIFTSRFLSVSRGIINEYPISENTGHSDNQQPDLPKPPMPPQPPAMPEMSMPPMPPQPPIPPMPPTPPKMPPEFVELMRRKAEFEKNKNHNNDLDNFDDLDSSDNDDISPLEKSKFLGSYGDPKLWAKSTLKNADEDDIVPVHAITAGMFTSNETVRNRMWLHDLLDDAGIPYYIEVGGMGGGRNLTEAQYIYVEKKNAAIAQKLIKEYNEAEKITADLSDIDEDPVISDDGVPQKLCPSCNEYIDFDHYKCPICKGRTE